MSVPIHESASNKLWGFVPSDIPQPAPREQAIRDYIYQHFVRDTVWVNVVSGWVTMRLAPEGVHVFTLHDIRRTTSKNDYGNYSAWFNLRTRDGLGVEFPAVYRVTARIGSTPESDGIGISPETKLHMYLSTLGLDFEAFNEEIMAAPALWPEHGEPSMFSDSNNICPELVQAIARHGPTEVQIPIVMTSQWGLGAKVKQVAKMKVADMTPVVVRADAVSKTTNDEFEIEAMTFNTMMDVLSETAYGESFLANDGTPVHKGNTPLLKNVVLPVVAQYPWVVTRTKADGTPSVTFPVSADGWSINGLVCFQLLAERLTKASAAKEVELEEVFSDNESLLFWVEREVPEFRGEFDEQVEEY